jgi:hypothetical protein
MAERFPSITNTIVRTALLILMFASILAIVVGSYQVSDPKQAQPFAEERFHGEIQIAFYDGVSRTQIEEIVSSSGGMITFSSDYDNTVVVRFTLQIDLEDANRIAKEIEKQDKVKYAFPLIHSVGL